MARISEFEHLKPQVIAEFEKGLLPHEVLKIFKQIPTGNVYRWFDAYKIDKEQQRRKEEGLPPIDVKSGKPVSNLIRFSPRQDDIDEDSLSDFELARRTIRNLIRDRKQPGNIRLQACTALLKSLELRAGIKIKDDDDDFTSEDLTELSDEDLQKISSKPEERTA